MTSATPAAGHHASPPLGPAQIDTLCAVAEAAIREPASPGLVAQLNPRHPRPQTLQALGQLHETGLISERPHPLTPLLPTYALTPAGRRWVRHHG